MRQTFARPQEILSIQYLRGFAALAVVVSHVLQWPLETMNPAFLKTGRLGVDVFFVISGFIITMIGNKGAFAPLVFLRRRAWRIVPLYWLATALVTVLALAMPHQFRTTVPTMAGFLKSLFFIPSEMPKAPLLGVGWTLDYEAFFYVAFALLFFVKSEMRTIVLCAAFAGLIAAGQLFSGELVWSFYTSASLLGFLFGTLLAQAWRHDLVARLAASSASRAMPFLGVALLFAYYAIQPTAGPDAPLYFHVLLSLTALSIVLGGLLLEQQERLFQSAVCKYLGDASYSIYLFHLFALGGIWAVAKHFLPIAHMPVYLAVSGLAVVLSLGAGLLAHHMFERPLLAMPKIWRAKMAAVVPAGIGVAPTPALDALAAP